ncbi:exodeoxyribonuclease VII large subunit [Helicobacter monodelphidis]|uniref:exodeoxyribonuclease VII large subunit n=1 Tax=Helicobacter sp. 15-1451 TaxID=2004995 RepID=UPI000DCC2684|nr:exodeoxyribonuclease VII large subunit [Helicobacter sp. 15-1451]RAX57504.1 exodeoxyribonuclease VII large subunit [Helicobacter sp. 15-1451]
MALRFHQSLMPKPLAVSEIIKSSKAILEGHFPQIAVFGEVSSVTYQGSGHIYFCLKDKDSEIKCVIWRTYAQKIHFKINKGDMLLASGKLTLYEARGEFQLQAQIVKPYEGVGALNHNLELLKQELEQKGYFSHEHKKPIPIFPIHIVLITSASGAVLHDMLRIAKKRWNNLKITLVPTIVQGENAACDIANKIIFADKLNADVLILARGGGSVEDLWAFNERIVADAIFNAKTPIVSAIGHDTDTPLSDFIADLRAPTPSGAMEMILPDKYEWFQRLDSWDTQLSTQIKKYFSFKKQRLQNLRTHLSLMVSHSSLQNHQEKIRYFYQFLHQSFQNQYRKKSQYLFFLQQNLQQLMQNKILDSHQKLKPLTYRLKSVHSQEKHKHLKQQLEFLTQQLLATKKQIIHNKKQKVNTLDNYLLTKNPEYLQKKGFVQIWHNQAVGEIEFLSVGERFMISDCRFKAIVELIQKEPLQGE